jgi:hypothetical protein
LVAGIRSDPFFFRNKTYFFFLLGHNPLRSKTFKGSFALPLKIIALRNATPNPSELEVISSGDTVQMTSAVSSNILTDGLDNISAREPGDTARKITTKNMNSREGIIFYFL